MSVERIGIYAGKGVLPIKVAENIVKSNKKDINKNLKKVDEKNDLNEDTKDTKQIKKSNDKTRKIKQAEKVRNENHIGAPLTDSKKTKDKKTGWWNK